MSNSTESAERQAFEKWFSESKAPYPIRDKEVALMAWQAAIRDRNAELLALVQEFSEFQISTYSQKERAQQWLKMKRKSREALARYSSRMGGNVTE
jgi:hypothetical protein